IINVLVKLLTDHWEGIKNRNDVIGRMIVFDIFRLTSRWIKKYDLQMTNNSSSLDPKTDRSHRSNKCISNWFHGAIRCLSETNTTKFDIVPQYLNTLLMASALRATEEVTDAFRMFSELIEDKRSCSLRHGQVRAMLDRSVIYNNVPSQITRDEQFIKTHYFRSIWHIFFLNIVLKPRPCSSLQRWTEQYAQRQKTWSQSTVVGNLTKIFLPLVFFYNKHPNQITKTSSLLLQSQTQYLGLFVGLIERVGYFTI
ncbi:hypothetical protein RFI_13016, partial [Reticulomyxa filosa]